MCWRVYDTHHNPNHTHRVSYAPQQITYHARDNWVSTTRQSQLLRSFSFYLTHYFYALSLDVVGHCVACMCLFDHLALPVSPVSSPEPF